MYRVQLKNFEGPLDLLLFFIKRDELDIYDIPMAYITRQFLEYIQLMEELDLDVASEFILMASMLMSIKAQMLLPQAEDTDELDEHDPRYELVQRLLQYKRYKEMAGKMQDAADEARKQYFRGTNQGDQVEKQSDQLSGEALQDVTLFHLMAAFKQVLANKSTEEVTHRVEKIEVTIEDQTTFILQQLRQAGRSSFQALCASFTNRIRIVVTFLAVLEMLREQQIALFVKDNNPTQFFLDLRSVDSIIEN